VLSFTWCMSICNKSSVCVWHDSFIRAAWRIHMCDTTHFMCAMTYPYVQHDSFICVLTYNGMSQSYSDLPHAYMRCMYVWSDSFICVIWHMYMCNMTPPHDNWHINKHTNESCRACHVAHVPYDTRMKESWHIYEWAMTNIWMRHSLYIHDSFICVPCLIRMCGMTHLYVCHDSFICVPCLIHMCAMPHSYVWHDSFMCVPWLIHMCAVTHSYVCHASFVCVPWLIHMLDVSQITHKDMQWVTSHIWMSHGTHMNESWHTFEWVMAHIPDNQHS